MPKIGFEIEILGRDKSSAAFGTASKSAGGMSKTMDGVGRAVRAAALPVIAFGGISVKAYGEAEVSAQEMSTAISNNKQLAGDSVASYQALAAAIQDKTAADDESVLSGAATLANFELNKQQITSMIPLVVDYARRTKKDIPDAAGAVGKALLGNARALKELGINFKPTGDKAKDFAAIQDLLRKKVGGFAEGEAKTSIGRLQHMKNEFNDLQEVVGGKLVGAFDFLSRNMSVVGPIMAGIVTGLVSYKVAMIASTIVTATFGTTAGAAWVAAAGPIGILVAASVALHVAISKLKGPVALFASAIAGLPFVVFRFRDEIFGALKAIGRFFADTWNSIRDALLAVWETIRSAAATVFNAVKAVIEVPLNALKIIFTTVWGAIKTVVLGVWEGIKAAAGVVFGAIRVVIETVLNVLKAIFTTIWRAIDSDVKAVWNALRAAAGVVFNAIKVVIETVLNVLKIIFTTVWGAIKTVVLGVWEGIKSGVSTAIGAVRHAIESTMNVISGIWRKMWDGMKGALSAVWEGIKRIVTTSIDWIVGRIQYLWNKLVEIGNKIKEVFGFGGGDKGDVGEEIGKKVGAGAAGKAPAAAHGAYVPKTPGGILMRVGEGLFDEWIFNEPDLRRFAGAAAGASSQQRSVSIHEGAIQMTVNGGNPAEVQAMVDRMFADLVRLLRAG